MQKKLFAAGILFLLVFQSCNNNEDLPSQDTRIENKISDNAAGSSSKTLSGYVTSQLSIQSEIKTLLESEKNVNYSLIQSSLQSITSIEGLEQLYNNANVEHRAELLSLFAELNSNTEVFIKSNPGFYSNYTEKERLDLLTVEIDAQLGDASGTAARENCHAGFVKATKRCMRTFALEASFAVVGGIFTGGIGGAIGGALATTHMVICNSDADTDYHQCVSAGGQP
jgi:hypothetical protein